MKNLESFSKRYALMANIKSDRKWRLAWLKAGKTKFSLQVDTDDLHYPSAADRHHGDKACNAFRKFPSPRAIEPIENGYSPYSKTHESSPLDLDRLCPHKRCGLTLWPVETRLKGPQEWCSRFLR